MEAVSTNDQTLRISGDETETFKTYSSVVHKVVVMVNTGGIGLLQLMNQQSSVFETHEATLLCFCILVLLYAVLRVGQDICLRLRPGRLTDLVGHTSHLFGGLAAIVMISVVFTTFALCLLLLWVIWLSAIVYYEFEMHSPASESGANESGAGAPSSSPV